MSSDEIKLVYLLLEFLRLSARDRPASKFNVFGRSSRGEFEIWLQKDVPPHEKQTLIWVYDELRRARLINSTETDLVNPNYWVGVSPKGQTVSESDFRAMFTEEPHELGSKSSLTRLPEYSCMGSLMLISRRSEIERVTIRQSVL